MDRWFKNCRKQQGGSKIVKLTKLQRDILNAHYKCNKGATVRGEVAKLAQATGLEKNQVTNFMNKRRQADRKGWLPIFKY